MIRQTNLFEHLHGAKTCLVPVDHALFAVFIAEEHVFGNRKIRNQRQFLMDDDDSSLLAVFDICKANGIPVQQNFTGIASVGIYAGEHVHERGLPRAIFTNQRVNFPSAHLQIYVVERLYAGKLLRNGEHFQYIVRHGCSFVCSGARLFKPHPGGF
ncbi:hypothetical protein SDC9_94635 [bioreactor metagenome]|uniref:Uncharacterized protein n=1 Tax=bioreactor metagenome TaxID=1076179 RepID=A0A645AE21_9ZZZZ